MKIANIHQVAAVHSTESDLQANHDGHMSEEQNRRLRAYFQIFLWRNIFLASFILVPVFVSAILILISTRPQFPDILWAGAGVFIPLVLAMVYGRDVLALLLDIHKQQVASDSGVVMSVFRRFPPRFARKLYLMVDGSRYYEICPSLPQKFQENEHYNIYFAPRSQIIIAVDGSE